MSKPDLLEHYYSSGSRDGTYTFSVEPYWRSGRRIYDFIWVLHLSDDVLDNGVPSSSDKDETKVSDFSDTEPLVRMGFSNRNMFPPYCVWFSSAVFTVVFFPGNSKVVLNQILSLSGKFIFSSVIF